jgi:hypothetical protein|tara:strand:+ start:2015 stop:2362 length:348 start_codon:yes stop_codon:yes gene_type:complete
MDMSICLNLSDVLLDEKNIIDKLIQCKEESIKGFNVIFWNKNLNENKIKSFIKRNEKKLFKLKTHIRKSPNSVWFLIITDDEMKSINSRYHTLGSIDFGIQSYREVMSYMNRRIS